MKAIQAEDLCYTYEDGTVALDHITFGAEKGKVTGILGANGAGKSTLFLSLNGVLTPKSGRVLLGGEPVRYDKKGLLELRRPGCGQGCGLYHPGRPNGVLHLPLPPQEGPGAGI